MIFAMETKANHKRVLVVDDEKNILSIFQRLLKEKDCEVISASDFEEARFAIENGFFDTVITDVNLGGGLTEGGMDLLALIEKRSPRTRVIVITGYGSREMENRVFELGGCFYFEKPVDLRLIKSVL